MVKHNEKPGECSSTPSKSNSNNKSKSKPGDNQKPRSVSTLKRNSIGQFLPPAPPKSRCKSLAARKSKSPSPEVKKPPRRSDYDRPSKRPREPEPVEEELKRSRRSTKHKYISRDGQSRQCCFCRDESVAEELKQCESCDGRYHLSKCLRYNPTTATNHFENDSWRCPRCITCATCHKLIDDPANVECARCSVAYHGSCRPKGAFVSERFNADWMCHSCSNEPKKKKKETYVLVPATVSTPPEGLSRTRKSRNQVADEKKLEFDPDKAEELTELINQRDHVLEGLNYAAGRTTIKPTPPQNPTSSSGGKKNNKKKKVRSEKEEATPFVLPYDQKLYESSRDEAYPPEPSSSDPPEEQWIHFGTGENCKAIYQSAFEEPLHSAPQLFTCKFCLHTTNIKADFVTHWKHCTVRFPPGNEIYRHDNLAFFEVDGAVQTKYCQDLCLISKLFIASKTLYDEVETFIFYVLCEIQREGYVIVGYFSKEKNPSKNNNLSCLLVLPLAQKMGYGSLLIDMSYELSRIEHKIGHPEHPLSDLGILAYRAYWRSSILCYLRNNRHFERMNLKDMSLATRITQADIINQMLLDNLIVLKNGVYSIKIGKRALKFPLSRIRRRAVDRSKITWKPKDNDALDPNKLNTYV